MTYLTPIEFLLICRSNLCDMNYKTNVVPLICAALMIAGTFLPWIESSGSSSYMGYSSSFKITANGIDAGIGYAVIGLAVACIVMIAMDHRLMIIPGAAALLTVILQFTGAFKNSVSVNMGFAEGHLGPSYGIYILLGSSILYIISTFKKLSLPPIQNSQNSKYPVENNIPVDQVQGATQTPVSPAPVRSLNIKVNWKIISLAIVILIVGFNYNEWIDSRRIKIYAIENEQQRIQSVINNINESIKKQEYDVALLMANQIQWQYDPQNNEEYVKQYEKQQADLTKSITQFKEEMITANRQQELAVQKQDLYNAIEELPTIRQSDPLFRGTRMFTDEGRVWRLQVTVENDTVTILEYPGLNNTFYTDKGEAVRKHIGVIVRGNIIASRDQHGEWKQIYRYFNNHFYASGGEGTEMEYTDSQSAGM